MGTEKQSIASKNRTGKTPEERSLFMSNLAKRKYEKMSEEDRKKHMEKMRDKRWSKKL